MVVVVVVLVVVVTSMPKPRTVKEYEIIKYEEEEGRESAHDGDVGDAYYYNVEANFDATVEIPTSPDTHVRFTAVLAKASFVFTSLVMPP